MDFTWPPQRPKLVDTFSLFSATDVQLLAKRFWWAPVLGGLLALATGLAVTHWFPSRYQSRAQVRFIPPQVAERYVTPNLSMQVEQRVYALAQLLRSRITATRIVDGFHLYPERRRFYTTADLLPTFHDDLKIVTVGSSSGDRGQAIPTVEISFSYPDAAVAQKVVQRLVEVVFEENRRYRTDQAIGTTEFLNEQAKTMAAEVEELEARIGELQSTLNTSSNSNQFGSATQRLYAIDTRIRDITDDLREREKDRDRAAQLVIGAQRRLAAIDRENPQASVLRFGWNSATDITRARMVATRARVLELRQRYLPSHPDRARAEQELKEAEQEYSVAVAEEVGQDRNLRKVGVLAEIETFEAERRAAEKVIVDLQRQESEFRAESQRVRASMAVDPETNTELLALTRQYDNLKEQFGVLMKKQQESQTASEMERRGQGETVEMIEPPSLPTSPQGMRRPWMVTSYGVAGIVLGVLLAGYLYVRRLRVSTEQALEGWSQVPVLAVFSGGSLMGPERPSQKLVDKWVQRSALSLLPFALLLSGCGSLSESPSALVERGLALEAKGNNSGASILYRRAIKADARFGPAYKALAALALRMGEVISAREAYIRAVELHPEDGRLKAKLADVSYRLYFSDPGRPNGLLREIEVLATELIQRWPKLADGHRIQAQALLERHQLTPAIESLERALTVLPGEPTLASQLAAAYYQRGDRTKAAELLSALLDSAPDFANAYDLLYLQSMQSGQMETAARTLLRKWEQLQTVDTGLQVAAHYTARNQRDKAMQFLDELVAAKQKEKLLHAKLGDFWLHRGDFARARAHYEEGRSLEPQQRSEYSGRLVELLLASGKAEEAQRLIETEKAHSPNDLNLQAIHAAVRLSAAKPDDRREARVRLEQLLSQMPASPFVRYHLGRAYLFEGNAPKAAEQLERSVALDPNYAPGWLALAEAELISGDATRGEQRARSLLRRMPGHPIALQLTARARMAQQRPAEAEDLLNQAVRSRPENLVALYDLFQVQLAQRHWDQAANTIALLRKSSPNGDWKVDLAEAQLAGRRGDTKGSLHILETALNQQSHVAALRGAFAALLLHTGQGARALDQYRALAKTQPDNFEYQLGLANAMAMTGRSAEALTQYEELQRQRPTEARVWIQYASLAQKAGRSADAIRAYRAAIARDDSNPMVLNNLAWILTQAGQDLPEALALAQRAQKLMPGSVEIDDTLAATYRRMGLDRNALSVYQQMLKYIQPESRPRIESLIKEVRQTASKEAHDTTADSPRIRQERPNEPRS
jgi:succinoglycan biosynthesis transport protein ExoP